MQARKGVLMQMVLALLHPEATGAARRVALMERHILTINHCISWSCPGPIGSRLCRKLQLEAQALTRGYVEAHGRALTRAVLASSDGQEWRAAREPRAPRPLCAELLQALAGAREEALQLIDSSVLQGTLSGEGAACLCDPKETHTVCSPASTCVAE